MTVIIKISCKNALNKGRTAVKSILTTKFTKETQENKNLYDANICDPAFTVFFAKQQRPFPSCLATNNVPAERS